MRRIARSPVRCRLAAALAAATGLAGPAVSEGPPPLISGRAESGVYHPTEDSYAFGQYTGLKDDAWYPFGNFDVSGRAAWDSGETWHFRARGLNLGLDGPWARAEGGLQGLFEAWVEWDEIPNFAADSTSMVFSGRGTDTLLLPPDWVPSDVTSGFAALAASENPVNVYRERRDLRAGAELVLPRGFELATEYEFERREGREVVGAVIGNSGGNPRAVLAPEHVDWATHEWDGALRYADERAQLELGYEVSAFDDRDDSFTWQNPYSAINGWNSAAGYPSGFGRKALPPDNRFHQLRASGGYSLPHATRVAANAAFGWYRQHDDFLPYTVNPAIPAPTPLPRDDAGAAIDATTRGLQVSSRPLPGLRIDAGYRFDDQDTDTPRDVYQYVAGDSLDQQPIDSDRARLNLPDSYRLHAGRIDVGYTIWERTEITAGYERDHEERSWTEADELDEDTFRLGLRSQALRRLDARIDAAWSIRDVDDYDGEATFLESHTPEYLATLPPDERFENLPGLRKFTYADSRRGVVSARVAYSPLERLSVGVNGAGTHDEYPNSAFGLRWRHCWEAGLDASWSPTDAVTTYAWYQYEQFESRLRSRSWSDPAQAYDAARNWRETDLDRVHSVGLGAEWSVWSDRLVLRADYVFAHAEDEIDVAVGPALTAGPSFPDTTTNLHDVGLQAEYRIREGLRARFGYLFEKLDVDDWAYHDVAPATVDQVLGLGYETPDYAAHLFALSFEVDF